MLRPFRLRACRPTRAAAAVAAALTGVVLAAAAAAAAEAPSHALGHAPADVAPTLRAVASDARAVVVSVVGLRSHESLRTDADGQARPAYTLASGVVIDARGLVLTTASAVLDCDAVQVRFADGRRMRAMLLGRDDASDVALLRLPQGNLPHARLAADGATAPGEWLAIAARPGGDGPRVSLGQVRRRYDLPFGSLLLLTNPVRPGDGGGALLNRHGELAGLVIGELVEAPADWSDVPPESAGASFALAAEDLRTLVRHLEEYGSVRRGFLGVTMTQGEVHDANRPDDPFRIGVRVDAVLPGSPAARAGLRAGDLIVGWNGETLQSPEDLMRRVEGSPPGTTASLVWVRDDERHDGRLVISARPDADLLAAPAGARLDPGPPGPGPAAGPVREPLLERVQRLRARTQAGPDTTTRPGPG